MELKGQIALVTGGAEGIGAGIAERLAAEGMHVVIADLDEKTGRATAARIGGSFVCADVGTGAGVRTAIDAAGQVGVLVNNAGGIERAVLPGGGPGEVGANARSEPAGGHARHAACPRPDDRTRRRSDHQHRLDRRAGNNRPRLTRVRGSQGRGDPIHGLPGTAARDDWRAGQLHLPGPGRHAGLAPIAGPDVAGRARRSSPGADARRHRDRGDGIPHRRHPGRADHAVSRRGARPASAAYRRADGITRPDCSGRRAAGRRRFRV